MTGLEVVELGCGTLLPTALLQEGGGGLDAPLEQRRSLAWGGLTPALWSPWDLVLSPQLDPQTVSVSAGSQGPAPACAALTPEAAACLTSDRTEAEQYSSEVSCSTSSKLGPWSSDLSSLGPSFPTCDLGSVMVSPSVSV